MTVDIFSYPTHSHSHETSLVNPIPMEIPHGTHSLYFGDLNLASMPEPAFLFIGYCRFCGFVECKLLHSTDVTSTAVETVMSVKTVKILTVAVMVSKISSLAGRR